MKLIPPKTHFQQEYRCCSSSAAYRRLYCKDIITDHWTYLFQNNVTIMATRARFDLRSPPSLSKLVWTMRLGGVWHFYLRTCLSIKAHSRSAGSTDSPWTLKPARYYVSKKKRKKESVSTWGEGERLQRESQQRSLSVSNPNTIILVIIHYYFNGRGLGLKVTSLHYRLLPHISNLGGPNFSAARVSGWLWNWLLSITE